MHNIVLFFFRNSLKGPIFVHDFTDIAANRYTFVTENRAASKNETALFSVFRVLKTRFILWDYTEAV